MSNSHISFITGLLFLTFACCLTESLAGGPSQGCQPYPPSCSAPVPGPYGPAQPTPSLNVPRHDPSFPGPVRVGSCEPRLVPLTYREEGPVRSIVVNAVGLLKATIQLPFKVIEAVLPTARTATCAPVCNRPQSPCRGNPTPSGVCPSSPVSACRVQPAACAPPGPVVGPLPRQATTPGCCGPQLPPQLVQEHRFSAAEPNNLLQDIFNLPRTIIQSGRWFGNLFSDSPNNPYSCGQVRP